MPATRVPEVAENGANQGIIVLIQRLVSTITVIFSAIRRAGYRLPVPCKPSLPASPA